MAMRLTGMYSGLDTDSVIQELVQAKSIKVDNLKKEKTKLEWKQTAWQDLNKKIYGLYSKTLSNLRYESNFRTKKATASVSGAVTLNPSSSAVNGVQTAKVNALAKAGYITGAEIEKADGGKITKNDKVAEALGFEFGTSGKASFKVFKNAEDTVGTQINIDENTTFEDLTNQLKDAGINANFDEKNQRFFLSAKETGKDNDFRIVQSNSNGNPMLAALGLATDAQSIATANYQKVRVLETQIAVNQSVIDDNSKTLLEGNTALEAFANADGKLDAQSVDAILADPIYESLTDDEKKRLNTIKEMQAENDAHQTKVDELKETYVESLDAEGNTMVVASNKLKNDKTVNYATKIDGSDAELVLNGATFTSSTNSFSINGLDLVVNKVTGEEFSITTQDDYEGMYDTIKKFLKEYNELINEMDKLYNADAAKGYEPLTDEEKEAMSEKEVEKWEEKIKGSLLRRDESLSKVRSAFSTIMSEGVEVNGKKMHLANFGIATLGYFNAEENERHAYHIDGDEDDELVSGKDNKLKSMIQDDPETVVAFFTGLAQKLYDKTDKLMESTDYSSIYKVYNDKQLKKDYLSYETKIKEAEKKLTEYEDRWYAKFSSMETAMAKLSSKESALSGLLGY